MEELSLKAQVLLKVLDILNACDEEHKVNVYNIMDKIEDLDIEKLFPNAPEEDIENIKYEMTQKSIGTTLTFLNKRNLVIKTSPSATMVGNVMKNLVCYYLA